MKNGIYLALILFLGSMGYHVIERLLITQELLVAGIIFLVISAGMGFLTTHYKRKTELGTGQKFINIIYIGVFAVYGIVTGFSLMYATTVGMSAAVAEGVLFLIASGVLIYSLSVFMKKDFFITILD